MRVLRHRQRRVLAAAVQEAQGPGQAPDKLRGSGPQVRPDETRPAESPKEVLDGERRKC